MNIKFFGVSRYLCNDQSRNILSEPFTNRRAKIFQANTKVNFLSWLVEFLGCFFIALDILVFGNRNNSLSGLMKVLTMLVYLLILPLTFLVNSSSGINTIVDQSWLNAIFKLFKPIQESDSKPPPQQNTPPPQQNTNAERANRRTQNQVRPTIPTISSKIESCSIKTKEHNATLQRVTQKKFHKEVKIAWQ